MPKFGARGASKRSRPRARPGAVPGALEDEVPAESHDELLDAVIFPDAEARGTYVPGESMRAETALIQEDRTH